MNCLPGNSRPHYPEKCSGSGRAVPGQKKGTDTHLHSDWAPILSFYWCIPAHRLRTVWSAGYPHWSRFSGWSIYRRLMRQAATYPVQAETSGCILRQWHPDRTVSAGHCCHGPAYTAELLHLPWSQQAELSVREKLQPQNLSGFWSFLH